MFRFIAEQEDDQIPMKENTNKRPARDAAVAAMLLAVGLLLPFLTGQIQQIGNMLLPMHLPVLLCGLICGWKWGTAVGFILPLFRFVLFGMPPIYPQGIAMAFELATYGGVVGALYAHSRWQCVRALYRCLVIAMLAGRVVWGVAEVFLLGLGPDGFTWQLFMAGAFLNCIPGIILQLIAVPAIMAALNRTGLVRYKHSADEKPGLA